MIYELHERPEPAVYAAAARWIESPLLGYRRLGTYVIADLGYEHDYPFADLSEPLLLARLRDADALVVATAVSALGQHMRGPTQAICDLAAHEVKEVRMAVARSLADREDGVGTATLIALCADPEAEVRRQAANALAADTQEDTEEARLALVRCLADDDRETREEAIFGLAMVDDPRVDEAMRAALARPDTGEIVHMAAFHSAERWRARTPQ
jgi:HEAT repeat protein